MPPETRRWSRQAAFQRTVELLLVLSCATCSEETGMRLSDLMPFEADGWKASGEDGVYDRETIFRYMDGAGEIYLSFDFRSLLVRRFEKPGVEPITAELYDMGASEEAFGIFTRHRRSEDAGIGQGSEYRFGYLLFWKGRYFAAVFAEKESPATRKGVYAVAASIDERIEAEGDLPDMIPLLPERDLRPHSISYFHRHTDLNERYFLSDDNILQLDSSTDALVAEYNAGDRPAVLLLVRYADEDRAASAYESFLSSFLPEAAAENVAQIEDGSWAGAVRAGKHIVALFDSPSENHAQGLLRETEARLKGGSG